MNTIDSRLASMAGRFERRPRILVVDDTPTNRKLLQAILARDDCEIFEAADGGEGLRIAREVAPDLILLDIMMPVLDGYRVCEELKRSPETAEIPVIFLSAKTESADKIRGLELGAVDYVTKPFSKGEILARVHTHLENRMLSQSLLTVNRELLRNQRRLEQDLRAASVIQQSLTPNDSVRTRYPEVEFGWVFQPCNAIGGDVFNVHPLDPDHVGIYVLDVSGHGVTSAMITVAVSQSLNPQGDSFLKERITDPPYYRLPGPAQVLERLDGEFPVERFDKYFTMSYLLLNLKTGRLRYARAAHPSPVLLRANGGQEELTEGGTIVGLGGMVPYREGEVTLQPGDRVIVYTDGINERPNPAGDRFGDLRVRSALEATRAHPISDVGERLHQSVREFAGGLPAEDDTTILAFEYRGRR